MAPGPTPAWAAAAASRAAVPIEGLAKPAPPLRCAVLAWDGWNWQAIFANGDETAAKAAAAEWLEQNPDKECQLMIAQPEGRAKLITKVEWGK
jgi:hypothetical protein